MNDVQQAALMFKGLVTTLPKELQNRYKDLDNLLLSEMRERFNSSNPEELNLVALCAYMNLVVELLAELEKLEK